MHTHPNDLPGRGEALARDPWWHGTLFFGAVTAASVLAAGRRRRGQTAFYERKRLLAWTPPGAVFPVLWPVNNAALTWGGLRLLNAPPTQLYRGLLLALQAVLWVDFLTYGPVYFGLRSPVLSALWTLTDAAASVASLALTRRTGDRKLWLAYAPITV